MNTTRITDGITRGATCLAAYLLLSVALPAQIDLPKPISGVFRVDPKGTGPDVFLSLDTAVRYLSLVGVSGEIEIVVAPGVYESPLRFFSIPGQQPDQKILIRSAVPGKARLQAEASILHLVDGCHDLVFDGFEFGASASAPAVLISGVSTNIEIRNCRFTEETGGQKVIEIQGNRKASGFEIHHNQFELSRGSYGIYTQGTTRMHVHHNDFRCVSVGEVISIWNSNTSESRIYDNVFRGEVTRTCIRLNVSGHDVDVYDNLFLLKIQNSRYAVIGSRGLRNRAWNRIHHNLFVVFGEGQIFQSSGPVAINHNSYAVESGNIGKIQNTVYDGFEAWQEALAEVAVDEQADQGSTIAHQDFFEQHAKLIRLFHDFEADLAVDGEEEEPEEAEQAEVKKPTKAAGEELTAEQKAAARVARRARLKYLIGLLGDDDVVVQRLAIRFLRGLGRTASSAVPALGRICNHPHAPVRADAVAALGEIRIGAEIVIPEILKLLRDDNVRVVLPAIRTLQGFAHLARQAEPDLRILANHDDEAVKAAAKTALAVILEQKKQ